MPVYRIIIEKGESLLLEASAYTIAEHKEGGSRVVFTDTAGKRVAEFNLARIVGFTESALVRKEG